MQTHSAFRACPRILAALLFGAALIALPGARGDNLVVDNGQTDTVSPTQGSGIYGEIIVGYAGAGTVNQSGGNLFDSGVFEMGVGPSSSGAFNLSGTGDLTVQGQALIGDYASDVTFDQSGGSFNVDGNLLQIGGNSGDNATYTLTGGSLSANQIQLAGTTGEVDQSGGTATTNGAALVIGEVSSGSDTYNLNGGTLTVGSIATGNSGAESTFNFNGGTLQAGASSASFFQGLTAANVRNNGAIFDTNGFNITVAQALIHSTINGDNATDGGLTKNGAGTLTLSGANTYNGATTVNAGTLVFADQTPASANLSVASGATLEYDVSGNNSITHGATTIAGAGTLAKSDTGTLTFGGNGTVNWNLSAGALINVTGGTLVGGNFAQDVWTNNLASLTVASGATFAGVEANVQVDALNGAGTVSTGYDGAGYQSFTVGINGGSGTFSGSITDTDSVDPGSLTKVGAGVQTLTGASTYSGATNINGGALKLLTGGSISSSGSALSVAAGATLSIGGGSVSLGTASGGDLLVGTTANNNASAAVSLGAGSSLGSANGYIGFVAGSNGTFTQTGGTYTDAGFLFIGYNPNATGTSAPPTGSYTLSSGQVTAGTTQLGNGGTGTFTQTGGTQIVSGTLYLGLNGGSGTYNLGPGGSLSSNNAYVGYTGIGMFTQTGGTASFATGLVIGDSAGNSGTYNLNGGTVTTDEVSRNAGSGVFDFDGGTLQASASSASFFQGLTTANVRNGGAIFDTNGYNDTVAQALIHSAINGDNATDGGLTKNGVGTLTLSGANTYNGATTVNAGTLVFPDETPASANLTVASGATLEYDVSSNTSLIHGATAIAGAGTLTKSGAGTLTFGGGGTVNWNLGAGALINVTGGTLVGGSFGQDVWTNNLASLTVASGATFSGFEANVQVDALNGAGTVSTGYNGAGYQSFTVGINGGSGTFSGSIADTDNLGDTGSLTKAGAGIQTLTGANTYSGATNVDGGTLQLLTGGSITSSGNALSVAAGATLSIGGGSVSLGTADGGDLQVGTTANNNASSAVSLSAGSLASVDSYIGYAAGSNGSFTQSGGTYTVAGTLFAGYDPNATGTSAPPTGSYTLSGGQLTAAATQLGNGGAGTFTQTGGTQTVSGSLYLGLNGGNGAYNLGPGGSLSSYATYDGYSGIGMFFQTGGSASNTVGLVLGNSAGSSGSYTLSAGTLMTNGILDGGFGSGVFNQSGGSVQSSDFLILGYDDGSGTSAGTGAYTLSGGTLSTLDLYIGESTAAAGSSFTQSGGAYTVNGAIQFGYQIATSAGTYNLDGGTVTTTQVLRNAGSATFSFNGGTLQAGASSASFFQGLTAANVRNGGAVFDTNGYNDTVAQPLIHSTISGDNATDGGLTKNGAGTLTLTAANTYNGATTVNAGTLLVNAASGSATGSGAVIVNSGATLAGIGSITGSVSVNSGAFLEPEINGPGTLQIGNASLTTSSLFLSGTLAIELGGANPGSGGYSQIITATGATIGGNLKLTLANGFAPTFVGEEFYIIDDLSDNPASESTGSFANAPGDLITDNAGDTYEIIYAGLHDPNNPSILPYDVTLVALDIVPVPEPGAWTLVAAGGCLGAGLLALRRRRGKGRTPN